MKKFCVTIIMSILFLSTTMCCYANKAPSDYYTANEHQFYYVVYTKDGKKGILLKNGVELIAPTEKEIEIPAVRDEEIKYDGKTYYFDKKFAVYEIDRKIAFIENAPIVIVKGRYGILSYTAKEFVLKPIYDYIEPLQGYYAKVCSGDKYALYNSKQNILSPFTYKDVRIIQKGKFSKTPDLVHYYVQEKTSVGWKYISSQVYKDIPKRLYEDTVLYYMMGGFMWDSLP